MERGKISVIIPVYNGAAWLAECVNSILKQSFQNFEVLILDDHSTDGTTELAQRLVQKDFRIRLMQRSQKGVSSARNQGIEETDGEYITFIDADDKIDCKMFENLLNCLEKENSDMVLCGYYRWNGENAENPDNGDYNLITVDKTTYISEYFLHGNTRCWSILYRRDVIGDVRFREDLTIGEDMMFLVDLMKNLKRISITDYKGYFYRINPNGAMLRPFTPSYMDEIRAWKAAEQIIGEEYPQQKARLSSILAVSSMLIAGKLSRLSKEERKPYQKYVAECRDTVKKALKEPGAKSQLPAGYGIKTTLFTLCPEAYLKLYQSWKG